ncbi:hypothetical protein L7F22_028831 [Adiantum nelumboides]|nr:hypothetical protein [Adiantum nelumboides]
MKQFLSSDAKDKVLTEWQSLKLTPYESIQKYVDKFWDLHLKATVYRKIDFEEQKQQFCAGLPEDMNEYVNSQRPKTISAVIHHTMVAAKINFQQGAKRNLKPMEIKEKHEHKGKNQPPNSSKGNSSNNKAKEKGVYKGKNRLTPEELERYRKDNRCFKCGEQGHAYRACPQRNARNEQPRASIIEAPKEDVHCKGSPLSYAWGKVREHDAFILFDPGSTHNFISHELAAKLGIQEFEMGDAMKVDGAFIGQDASVTPLIGKLRLHIQGYGDKEDFFISPLKHEDIFDSGSVTEIYNWFWFWFRFLISDSVTAKGDLTGIIALVCALLIPSMGTAVLFPQDCLPISKSRRGNNFTDSFSRVPVATDSTFQLFDSSDHARHNFMSYHGVGQLYPYQARHSFTLYSLQREVEQRKPTSETLWCPQEHATLSAIPMSDVPSFTILQRPKGDLTANGFAARFLTISDISQSSPKVSELRSGTRANGTKPCKSVQNVPLDKKKRNGLNGKKCFFDTQMGKSNCNIGLPRLYDSVSSMSVDREGAKAPKGEQSKPYNPRMGGMIRPRRSCDDILMLSKGLTQLPLHGFRAEQSLQTLHAAESVSSKGAFTNRASRIHGVVSGPARLRRASTDSQIVEHLGQYRSQVLQTPSNQGNAFTRTASMPLPESERWAGPAYSSSPEPSSLPIPQFSVLGQKIHGSPLLGERQQSNITKPVELGSTFTAPGSHHGNGELDVAFATMSLRRMLKLDLS